MSHRARDCRPQLEVLEDRIALSTFTQTFTANVNIPDGPNGAWVGWDVDARSLPAGAVVTGVTVHEVVKHSYVGDLEVKLSDDSGHSWTIRDNVGGSKDNFDETKTNATVFSGAAAGQVFHYRIRDTARYDKGYLDRLDVSINYVIAAPVRLQDVSVSTAQARDGQTIHLGYLINNPTGAAAAVTLDGNLTDSAGQVLSDPYRVTTVTATPGMHWYYRDFWVNVPPSPAAGAYDVGYEIRPAGAAAQDVVRADAFTVLPPIDVRVPILMFHHVDHLPLSDPANDGGVTPETLRETLRALKAQGYTFITFTELMQMRAGDLRVPPKPIMLTFDDGYRDFLTTALPILKEFNARATEFIITEMVDPANHMTWDELAAVQATGLVDLEAHTVTHPDLTQLSDADLRAELVNSKQALESHLGKEVRYLAYPYGDYDARVEQFAYAAGYGAAVKAWGGVETTSESKFELNRIYLLRSMTTADILAQLGGTAASTALA